MGFNVLPFIMTAINLCAVFVSSEPESKERKQGIFIAMAFFVLLYTSPAALLIYWTFSQLFNLIRYLIVYPFPKIKQFYEWLNFSFAYQFMLSVVIYFTLTIWTLRISKTTYAAFTVFGALIIYKFIMNRKIYFRIPNFETVFLNMSVMAFPAILIFKSNMVYFDASDSIFYFFILLLFSVIISFLLSEKFSVSLIFAAMFLPLVREVTHFTSEQKPAFLTLFIVALIFISSFVKQKRAVIAFSLTAFIYILLFFVNDFEKNPSVEQYGKKGQIPEDLAGLELKDSVGIYLFMHDGFPHKDFAEYMNLPNYNDLMDVFKQNDFKIYDVYSMKNFTLGTMSSVFSMVTDPEMKSKKELSSWRRGVVSGNSISNLLLQKNGYSTGIYGVLGKDLSDGDNLYNFSTFNKNDLSTHSQYKNNVLKRISAGNLNSMVGVGGFSRSLKSLAEFSQNDSEKMFAWGTGCPGHSTMGALGTTEREMQKYIPNYNKCLAYMKEEIEMAAKSNAIIIFMSDHGPWLMDGGQKFPANYDFNKTDYMKFRDVFGALMAIRFPDKEKAEKYDMDFNVTQDLFPIIFAYLFDSEIPLKYKVQNTELRIGPHKFDKGVFYENEFRE
jgi:hypothetical protein